MNQLQHKVNSIVVTGKTLSKVLLQKESQQLGTYVWQKSAHASRASSAKATNDPPGVETYCFTKSTNNNVATPRHPLPRVGLHSTRT
jgi:hypothetical protein